MSAEKLVIDKSTLEDIGDAVREKEGSSELIPVTELKPRILAIQTGADTSDATASAGEVLSGETFYADGKKTGTMTNNGAVSKELSAGGSYTIPAGYHNGSGKVTAKDLESQTSGTAGTGDILSGKTAWVGGSKVTGEMPVNSPSNKELPWTITTMPQGDGDATIKIPVTAGYYEEGQYPSTALPMKFQSDITPGTSDITVSGGAYFPGSFKVKGDTDLVAANIKKGVEIFGKTGTYTSDATAAAGDMVSGKTAYVNGSKITGTLEEHSGQYSCYPDDASTIMSELCMYSTVESDTVLRKNTILETVMPLSDFGDAAVVNVLSGKTFTSSAGYKREGTMANQGAKTASLNTSTTSYTIPAGYHNGSGKVSITTQEKSVTPTSSAQTITPDSGKVLSKVTVAAASGKQVYSGTFTSGLLLTSLTIPVGVSLSDSDTFVLVYTGERYNGLSRDEGTLVTSAVKNGSNNMIVFVEGYYDGYDPYPVVVTATDSITFSGTNVTVSSGSSNTHFCSKEPYCWYLIKG